MNRATETTSNVNLSNFAGADDVGRNVTTGIFLEKDEGSHVMKLSILKNREGPTNRRFAWVWDVDTGIRRPVAYEYDEGNGPAINVGGPVTRQVLPNPNEVNDTSDQDVFTNG
jgi:hypothetical protein